MGIMGWSSTAMAARYQDVTDPIRRQVASQIDGLCGRANGLAPMTTETRAETKGPAPRRAAVRALRVCAGQGAEDGGFEPPRAVNSTRFPSRPTHVRPRPSWSLTRQNGERWIPPDIGERRQLRLKLRRREDGP